MPSSPCFLGPQATSGVCFPFAAPAFVDLFVHRMLQELSLRKCPALKSLPTSAADMTSLRELDVRAPKKQVCKITPEVAEILKNQDCMVRGGVVKKGKGGGKKK